MSKQGEYTLIVYFLETLRKLLSRGRETKRNNYRIGGNFGPALWYERAGITSEVINEFIDKYGRHG